MTDWAGHLADFHARRPGITEDLLAGSVDEHGDDPYGWLVRPIHGLAGPVVDVGCGSAPTAAAVGSSTTTTARWVGIDVSLPELARARERGRGPLVAARAEAAPVRTGGAVAVVASMSLMVVGDPCAALVEAARVLRPGGLLVALVPGRRPLTVRDRLRYGQLLAVLGRAGLPLPRPDVPGRLPRLLEETGFEVVADHRRRFAVRLRGAADGERFVDSLYLPGVGDGRQDLARALVKRWRGSLGLPLRRVVARQASSSRSASSTPRWKVG